MRKKKGRGQVSLGLETGTGVVLLIVALFIIAAIVSYVIAKNWTV